jgi:enoyl-[acyl-carrier protein] reductase I
MDTRSDTLLAGRKGLVVGIANEHSIAYGCARIFRRCGAELAVTWLNDKARPHVEPLARELEAPIAMALDVEQPGAIEAVFDAVRERWGRLDFVLHSIAFAPAADLHGRVADSSREGFGRAMDISCHSFARIARLAEPLMADGGTFDDARRRAPLAREVEIDDVGSLCAFLVSDAAQAITGDVHYVDGGFHILA